MREAIEAIEVLDNLDVGPSRLRVELHADSLAVLTEMQDSFDRNCEHSTPSAAAAHGADAAAARTETPSTTSTPPAATNAAQSASDDAPFSWSP